MASSDGTGRPAVLFDIDGTLVDTNYLHALAWRRAFLEVGCDVPTAWIHHRIGMGSDQLMEELVGEVRDDAKEAWRRHFDPLKDEIRALPGARDLLLSVADAGGLVVLASSAEPEDVDALVAALDVGDVVHAVTSSGDVEQAKPAPDVFEAALDAAGVPPDRAVVVGDTVWDVLAARRVGLDCVGVLTGGIDARRLVEAGAVAVYQDPAELHRRLGESPVGALLSRAGTRPVG